MLNFTRSKLRDLDNVSPGAAFAHWTELRTKITQYIINAGLRGNILREANIYVAEIDLKLEVCREQLGFKKSLITA